MLFELVFCTFYSILFGFSIQLRRNSKSLGQAFRLGLNSASYVCLFLLLIAFPSKLLTDVIGVGVLIGSLVGYIVSRKFF